MISWVKKDIKHIKENADVFIRNNAENTRARISFNDVNGSLAKCDYIEIGIDEDAGRMYFRPSDNECGYKVSHTGTQFILSTSSLEAIDFIKDMAQYRALYYDKELGFYYIQKDGE